MPPRPGRLPRLEYAIPCRRFDNQDVDAAIDGMLEAAELRKPGIFRFQLAVKLLAETGPHRLTVTAMNPKGLPEDKGQTALEFTVEDAARGERLSLPVSFPCEYVGWWALELALDGQKLGETQLWVQFTPY